MLTPGQSTPDLSAPLLGGGRWELTAQSPDTFTVIVFYRGHHCPICKSYLADLEAKLDAFAERGAQVLAISMDGEARARATWDEVGLSRLPLAHDMTRQQAMAWNLYLSGRREGSQEPEVFSEPGLAVLRADGTLFFTQVQNAPFTRPPLDELLKGLSFVTKNDYPTRGTWHE